MSLLNCQVLKVWNLGGEWKGRGVCLNGYGCWLNNHVPSNWIGHLQRMPCKMLGEIQLYRAQDLSTRTLKLSRKAKPLNNAPGSLAKDPGYLGVSLTASNPLQETQSGYEIELGAFTTYPEH